MIKVRIAIPQDITKSIAGQRFDATIEPGGYSIKAVCRGWGRNPDGSIRLDIKAEIRSPEGTLPPYRAGGGS